MQFLYSAGLNPPSNPEELVVFQLFPSTLSIVLSVMSSYMQAIFGQNSEMRNETLTQWAQCQVLQVCVEARSRAICPGWIVLKPLSIFLYSGS